MIRDKIYLLPLVASLALMLLGALLGCTWPECNCERSNTPCQASGFEYQRELICKGERQ